MFNCSFGGFFNFPFQWKTGPKPRRTFWKSGNKKIQGNFYSETLRTSAFIMWSCSSEDTTARWNHRSFSCVTASIHGSDSDKQIVYVEQPPNVCLCRSGLVQVWQAMWDLWTHLDHCVTLISHRGVCCRAKLLESKPYGQWPGKYGLKCSGSSWVSNILFSQTWVFLCSCLSSDNFQMALVWCKIAKADPRYS